MIDDLSSATDETQLTQMIDALAAMRDLLRAHGFSAEADETEALRIIVRTYVDAAWEKLRHLGFVWAAMNTYESHDIDRDELRRRIEQARTP